MSELWLLAVVCFVAMVSPGPDFVLVTRNALRYPKPQALVTALGIVAGCLVHASYCILGLAFVITQSVLLFSSIKIAGACYLVYLGIRGLLSKPAEIHSNDSSVDPAVTIWQAFLQGFLCNLLNPKLAVFLLSLFTQFVSLHATTAEKAIVASIFVFESALYWPLLVLLLQGKAVQTFFASMRVYLDRACGAMLILLGLRVAFARD